MCVGRIFFGNGARLPSKKKRKKNRGNVVDLHSFAKGKVNLQPFS
jgi:hypothetical protein